MINQRRCQKPHQTSLSSSSTSASGTPTNPQNPTQQHGTICWLEIPVVSAARAAAFYAAVFGWECDPPPGPSTTGGRPPPPSPPANGSSATVHVFRKGGGRGLGLSGAFIQVPEDRLIRAWDADSPGRTAVLTTFAVESIEGTLARVEEMGGRAHL